MIDKRLFTVRTREKREDRNRVSSQAREKARRERTKKKLRPAFPFPFPFPVPFSLFPSDSPFRVHEGVSRVRPVPVRNRGVRRRHGLSVLLPVEAPRGPVLSQGEAV